MSIDWGQGVALMAGPYMMGLTEVSPETVGYWAGVRERRLLIKKCTACGKLQHPRRLFCLACRCDAFEWVETKGTGTVYTFSTVHRAPTEAFAKEAPYTVGILHLDEDVYFFSRIIPNAGGEVRIGAPVRLEFRDVGVSGPLPVYVMT